MSIVSFLFRLARFGADAKAVSSGRIARRAKNKAVGRALGPFWRGLWR